MKIIRPPKSAAQLATQHNDTQASTHPGAHRKMFRNQYDTDVTVWSPEGRLLQVGLLLTVFKLKEACMQ